MASDNKLGFLHLSDVIARHKKRSMLSGPNGNKTDIDERLKKQAEKNGVVLDLRLGHEAFLSGD